MTTDGFYIDCPDIDSLDEKGRAAYDGLRRADGSVHNLYKPFAVWPTPVRTSDQLYRDLMHSPDGPLTMAQREFVGTHVAILSGCSYAATHHGANFVAFWGNGEEAEAILQGLRDGAYDPPLFDAWRQAVARHTEKLTKTPEAMTRDDVEVLRRTGLNDTEILQVNQIAANFNYWVRTINGLGITMGDESVGLEPATIQRLREANGETD